MRSERTLKERRWAQRSNSLYSARSGRTLVLGFENGVDDLKVVAPDGAVEFIVRLTPDGPVLQLEAARVELVGTREVQVTCGKFSVDARDDVTINAGRDITHNASGRTVLDAGGSAEIKAKTIELDARLGEIRVHANDDVVVEGERIYLNR